MLSSAWLCGTLPPCRMPPHTLNGVQVSDAVQRALLNAFLS